MMPTGAITSYMEDLKHFYTATLDRAILWRIQETDEEMSPPLEQANSMVIANPLLLKPVAPHEEDRYLFICRADGNAYCLTQQLWFRSSVGDMDSALEALNEVLRRLRVRFSITQAKTSSVISLRSEVELCRRSYEFQPENGLFGAGAGRHYVDFALLSELDMVNLEADHLPADLLVDAIDALDDLDFRRALIFAAISAESAASSSIERLHSDALNSHNPPFPVIDIHDKGDVLKIDPVFKVLWKDARGNYLHRALHEARLHLRLPSLLIENDRLFHGLKRLSATRNKLVHRGLAEPADDRLDVTRADAIQAISFVHGLLQWLDFPVGPWESDFPLLAYHESMV